MKKEPENVIDDMVKKITETLEEIKDVVKTHIKIDELLEPHEFAAKMSIINIALAKTIIDQSESYADAYSYAARVLHTLVDVIDKHKERQEVEEDEEDDDEHDEPVH